MKIGAVREKLQTEQPQKSVKLLRRIGSTSVEIKEEDDNKTLRIEI